LGERLELKTATRDVKKGRSKGEGERENSELPIRPDVHRGEGEEK